MTKKQLIERISLYTGISEDVLRGIYGSKVTKAELERVLHNLRVKSGEE